MVINSRPLTCVSSDDLQEPLTPAHFLTGRRVLSLPDGLYCGDNIHDEDVDFSRDHLTKRMKYLNVVLDHFWKRWQQEYLLELRESHRHYKDIRGGTTTINTDDIVLLQEEKPRAFRKLAKVKQLITGRDGKVRAAILTVPSATGQTSTFQRPIQLLYPLETSWKKGHHNRSMSPESQLNSHQNVRTELPNNLQVQPKRAAALKAMERLRELNDEQ